MRRRCGKMKNPTIQGSESSGENVRRNRCGRDWHQAFACPAPARQQGHQWCCGKFTSRVDTRRGVSVQVETWAGKFRISDLPHKRSHPERSPAGNVAGRTQSKDPVEVTRDGEINSATDRKL